MKNGKCRETNLVGVGSFDGLPLIHEYTLVSQLEFVSSG
jgi:hypothetical protein